MDVLIRHKASGQTRWAPEHYLTDEYLGQFFEAVEDTPEAQVTGSDAEGGNLGDGSLNPASTPKE